MPEPDPPTVEQAARIVAAAWEQDDGWGTLVWLTMITGMRRGELLGLRWLHVNLDDGTMWIRRNYVRGIEKDTKTHQRRRVALDAATVEILTVLKAQYETRGLELGLEPTDRAFLFSTSPTCDRPRNPDAVSRRYTKMCAELGIDSHLHALRPYTATELITAG